MKERIESYLKKQSFQPGIAAALFNPFFLIRRALFKEIKKQAPLLSGKLMDFGCGRKPYENLFTVSEYIGVDIQTTGHDHRNSRIDVFYDGNTVPFPDATFDAIFCSEVLEHIFNPDEILQELQRVLKPGGSILLTVPFCWNEHEVPYDYGRYSSFGIAHLMEKNGFKIRKNIKTGNFVLTLFQLWSLFIYETFKKGGRPALLVALIFIVPIHLLGLLFSVLLPSNKTLYFNNVIVAEK